VPYVKLTGHVRRHEFNVSELTTVDGKTVRVGVPVNLSAEEKKSLEGVGYLFEDSSKEEHETYENSFEVIQPVGADVGAAAPLFGSIGTAIVPGEEDEPTAPQGPLQGVTASTTNASDKTSAAENKK
jgi:hypothetical protein